MKPSSPDVNLPKSNIVRNAAGANISVTIIKDPPAVLSARHPTATATAKPVPSPRVKPKPPKKIAKKKPKKPAARPKRKTPKKPKFDADHIAALLNKLPDDPAAPAAETGGRSEKSELRVAGLDQRVTRSEMEYLRQEISRC